MGEPPKPILQTLESKVQNLKNLYLQRFKKDVEVEHLLVFAPQIIVESRTVLIP